jgi:hypothetical protein
MGAEYLENTWFPPLPCSLAPHPQLSHHHPSLFLVLVVVGVLQYFGVSYFVTCFTVLISDTMTVVRASLSPLLPSQFCDDNLVENSEGDEEQREGLLRK